MAAAESPDDKSNYVRLRQLVYYRTNQPVGTLVVDKNQTFLYVVRPNVSALRYNIGVGPECTALSGLYHVVRKEERPSKQRKRSARASFISTRTIAFMDPVRRFRPANWPAVSAWSMTTSSISTTARRWKVAWS